MSEGSRRRKELKAALALAGITGKQFAANLGVTPVHVFLVAKGERVSPRVEAAIDAFIARYRPLGRTA